ncbi:MULTISPECIES: hypothetical protein [Rhodococcus]|uniref:hypothetical protein n=1 Tax=Rhodococcus TaxID=1827 RepID=UPI000AB59368|nr:MULTISPECIES: hypothetical protein [Rhodococcus]QQZ18714.1 hypothetical protein GO592_34725 [Rhodococcus sp. 21391]
MITSKTDQRGAAVVAIAAIAALTFPGSASAAERADAKVGVNGNSATVTISVPEPEGDMQCSGPWVHTSATAALIEASPLLDLKNHPEHWFNGPPVHPALGYQSGELGGNVYIHLNKGQTGVANVPVIADGDYVAGIHCVSAVNGGPVSRSLTLEPFTVGSGSGGARGSMFGS